MKKNETKYVPPLTFYCCVCGNLITKPKANFFTCGSKKCLRKAALFRVARLRALRKAAGYTILGKPRKHNPGASGEEIKGNKKGNELNE